RVHEPGPSGHQQSEYQPSGLGRESRPALKLRFSRRPPRVGAGGISPNCVPCFFGPGRLALTHSNAIASPMLSKTMGFLAPCLLALGATNVASAAESSISLDVSLNPTALKTGGVQMLIYELHIVSRAPEPRAITRVEVRDAAGHQPLLILN